MKEVLSIKVNQEDSLSMIDLLSLHQFSKYYNGSLYILVNQKLIKLDHLAKLVSYLLTNKSELTIIVEGHSVQETLSQLQKWCKKVQSGLTETTALELSM
jgi:hypothetical protein